jgi:hypothetical protein
MLFSVVMMEVMRSYTKVIITGKMRDQSEWYCLCYRLCNKDRRVPMRDRSKDGGQMGADRLDIL